MNTVISDLIAGCESDWRAYTQHDFVCQLAAGSLPAAAFRYYLQQDYLFLIHFARAYALAIFKSDDLEEMRSAKQILNGLLDMEISMHIEYCKDWGIDVTQLQQIPEDPANVAYTRFVIDCGLRGSLADLYAALAPCVIGYGEIANWLLQQPFTRLEGNPYESWIKMYASEDYQAVSDAKRQALERLCNYPRDSARFESLAKQFTLATQLEAAFWQMVLEAVK